MDNVHHVLIAVELRDGKLYCYDCGNARHWKEEGKNGNAIENTKFLTENAPGKIIRVKSP